MCLINLAIMNYIPKTHNRLSRREKLSIQPGSIFIYSEKEAGILRWTDRKEWTPSRVHGIFLYYRELNGDFLKKTYTVSIEGSRWHIVSYTKTEWEATGGCCAQFQETGKIFGTRQRDFRASSAKSSPFIRKQSGGAAVGSAVEQQQTDGPEAVYTNSIEIRELGRSKELLGEVEKHFHQGTEKSFGQGFLSTGSTGGYSRRPTLPDWPEQDQHCGVSQYTSSYEDESQYNSRYNASSFCDIIKEPPSYSPCSSYSPGAFYFSDDSAFFTDLYGQPLGQDSDAGGEAADEHAQMHAQLMNAEIFGQLNLSTMNDCAEMQQASKEMTDAGGCGWTSTAMDYSGVGAADDSENTQHEMPLALSSSNNGTNRRDEPDAAGGGYWRLDMP